MVDRRVFVRYGYLISSQCTQQCVCVCEREDVRTYCRMLWTVQSAGTSAFV